MNRTPLLLVWLLLVGVTADAAAANWPSWVQRAPLNMDDIFVDPAFQRGLARAWRSLAFLINIPILLGLIYAFEGERADFSNAPWLIPAIIVSGYALSMILSPHIHALSIFPIIALEAFLLIRFCMNSLKSAFLVVVLYHVFQIGCIVAYRVVAAYYA